MTDIRVQLQQKIDLKTKPLGALGILEKLALQIGTVQNTLQPSLYAPTIFVFAADHGIAQSGVSAYPPEVTFQMVMNFLNGGAAINIFSRQNEINLKIIDAGVNYDFPSHPLLIDYKIAKGTNNFLQTVAMSNAQLDECFQKGRAAIEEQIPERCNVIGFGEMGIGNTSSAALLMSALCDLPLKDCVGRGTGLNDSQLARKVEILTRAKEKHVGITLPKEVLQTFGGFEIAQMCGAMLHAYEKNMLLIIDGFIATSAFLVATKMKPEIQQNAIFSHLSDEFAHAKLLAYLEATPVLQLNMRLGEGTGCAVAFPILKSAVNFLNEMTSFEDAGVTNKEE
ncbi:MAG: nicotinate-nucleotide--dimethylbenzimidazole phosphoribosyltransferase [Bacteroidota bacterium]